MLIVETVRGCGRAPALLFALEELGLDYDVVEVAEGRFLAEHGVPGPALVDGDLRILGIEAALRHAARRARRAEIEGETLRIDLALEHWIGFLGPAVYRLVRDPGSPEAREGVDRALRRLEALLGDGDWVAGPLTIGDFPGGVLGVLGQRVELSPALAAYARRLTSRPAFVRARARLRALDAAPARFDALAS